MSDAQRAIVLFVLPVMLTGIFSACCDTLFAKDIPDRFARWVVSGSIGAVAATLAMTLLVITLRVTSCVS